jgi:hypothetical protein
MRELLAKPPGLDRFTLCDIDHTLVLSSDLMATVIG